jgi:hypothetical protein
LVLIVCSACKRHIRDAQCPFCGTANTITPAPARRVTKGLTRAAIVLGAAVSVGGCGDEDTTNADASVADTSIAVDAAYGAPPDGGEADAETGMDAPTGPDAAYGGPPDAGN